MLCKAFRSKSFKLGLLLGSILLTNTFAVNAESGPTTEPGKIPAILMSNGDASQWRSMTNIKLPDGFNTAFFIESLSCRGKNCLIAGTSNIGPLILNSTDGGNSWLGVNADNIHQGDATGSQVQYWVDGNACSKSFCVITGTYNRYLPVNRYQPYVLVNTAGTDTWNQINPQQLPLPAEMWQASMWFVSACNDISCIILGSYPTDSGVSPLIMISNDGIHWNAADLSSLHLPSITSPWSIDCAGGTCTITAWASDSVSDPNVSYQLILNSNDSGQTWSLVNPHLPTLDHSVPRNLFCSVLGCVSTLMNINADSGSIFNSNIDHTVWTTVPTSNITLPKDINPHNPPNPIIYSVTCSDKICVAGGSYNGTNNSTLLLINKQPLIWQGVEANQIDPNHGTCNRVAYTGSNFICVGVKAQP